MSDADKPTPEGAPAASPEAKAEPIGAFGKNVISIEAARAELLRKPKTRSAGVIDLSRPRGREVPSPVTMPPGEHSAVIVADTPAARAHFDKKTVHPGEAPARVHDKKVRVKTSLDPRRAKTQMSDKRALGPDGQPITVEDASGGNVESLWSSKSQPPPSMADGRPSGELRPSGYARKSSAPPREAKKGSPLFLAGVAVSAALGAVLVFMLTRHSMQPSPQPPATSLTSFIATPTSPRPVVPSAMPSVAASTAPTASSAPSDTATVPTASVAAPQPTDSAAAGASAGGSVAAVVKTARPVTSVKPSASASVAPSVKPTATFTLPFGKEEP